MMSEEPTHSAGLGRREATGGETILDVTAAEIGEEGALLTVQVRTDALLGCPESATVIVRPVGGASPQKPGEPPVELHKEGPPESPVLARRDVPLDSDYPFFGLVSIEAQCAGQGRIRVPGVGPSDRVSFAVAFGDEVAAEGPAVRLGDLAGQPAPQPPDQGGPGDVGDEIGNTIGAAVRPVLGWGAALGAGYLLVTNLPEINSALTDGND
jgi:hypothetical protein